MDEGWGFRRMNLNGILKKYSNWLKPWKLQGSWVLMHGWWGSCAAGDMRQRWDKKDGKLLQGVLTQIREDQGRSTPIG